MVWLQWLAFILVALFAIAWRFWTPFGSCFRSLFFRLLGPPREKGGNRVRDNRLNREPPARNCTVVGCGGRMRFHPSRSEAPGPHTLEWPWHATWVCETSPAHIAFATPEEERAAAETWPVRSVE